MNNRLTLLLLLTLLVATTAWSREAARTTGLSQDMYEQMQEIQAMIEGGELKQAHKRLQKLQARRLTDYELAQTWFLMGYVHYQREDYGAAIGAYKQVLVGKDLPMGLQQNVTRTLAQLNMVMGNFNESLVYLDRWSRSAKSHSRIILP